MDTQEVTHHQLPKHHLKPSLQEQVQLKAELHHLPIYKYNKKMLK
jgi:hypothetical protein